MGIKLVGVQELSVALKRNMNMDAVKTAVKFNGSELQKKAEKNAPVDTGNLKRSIGLEIKDGGLTAECRAKAEYAGYVEYGTRRMEAQPYMGPAFNEQKKQFKKDLKELVR